MKFRSCSKVVILLCLAFCPGIPRGLSQSVPQLIPQQGLRLSQIPIRDPWILAYAPTRTYYLYATKSDHPDRSIPAGAMVYKSKDLVTWSGPFVVFTVPKGTWCDRTQNAWAPEAHEYKGKFYLFLTLHNPHRIIARPPTAWRRITMKGTTIAVGGSPDGPFTLVKTDGPIPPADFLTLDGTLYVAPDGQPWMVYAHEWAQKIDGTMEAVPLKQDLSDAAGKPIFLFKGSDAPWLDTYLKADRKELSYVTDGPELFRTKDGHLLMLWSSFGPGGYIETVARSKSGQIQGPWEQLSPLLEENGGHGMLFHTFAGQLMMVLHQPNTSPSSHAKLFEMSDRGDHLEVIKERTDLDGAKPSENAVGAQLSR